MKIAIVDQHGNPGGGVRFVRALAEGLAEVFPADEIAVFATDPVLATDAMRQLVESHPNVSAVSLGGETKFAAVPEAEVVEPARVGWLRGTLRQVPALARLYRRLRRIPDEPPPPPPADPSFVFSGELVQALNAYDLVYLSWPFFIRPPDGLEPAVVGTFHDFNFKHGFGNFGEFEVSILDEQVGTWLRRSDVAVVSTGFIRSELERFYRGVAAEVDVIPLATFVTMRPSAEQVRETRARLGLPDGYLLYPCNIARHKNLRGMLEAQGLLKQRGIHVSLVLCGWGTDFIAQQIEGTFPWPEPYLVELADVVAGAGLEVGRDLFLLGYVSDADMDALVSGATLVVSPSRYEAGSGPGLDAWALGAPVALSAIPAHTEQVGLLGVEAYFFDESDPADMADVIANAVAADNSGMVERSAEALARYDWKVVAQRYHAVFERAVERRRGGTARSEEQ